MANIDNTLFIRNFPPQLCNDDKEELLKHFEASQVRCMSGKGRLKNCAFAAFLDQESACRALKRLHQLEVLGSKLSVEYAKTGQSPNFPSVLNQHPGHKKGEDESIKEEILDERLHGKESENQVKVSQKINSAADKWRMEYPLNPRLRYLYPPPTADILTNIANTLATVPKFYVQCLHLMNKMNLPTPFGLLTATPPLAKEAPPLPPENPSPLVDMRMEGNMDISSSEESELASDEDTVKPQTSVGSGAVKRPAVLVSKPVKRPKLRSAYSYASENMPASSSSTLLVHKPGDVFDEQTNPNLVRKISINFPPSIPDMKPHTDEVDIESANKTQQIEMSQDIIRQESIEAKERLISDESIVIEGGFGKMEPEKREIKDDGIVEEEEWGSSAFISSRMLRRKRLSHSEMKEYNVFRSYQSGDPTSRLYIKNLSKQVDEKDLHYIFGKYVNWDNETEKIMFDIRLMKEGRMKGQAFITLPSDDQAKEALNDTNAFMLHGKPMVVQFARSAKPKADGTKT